ncbi:hypothetical protein [Nocardia brevicatena]|uniref:hypothetical protein n=1 Tax=Nocardia brevicatena TaxID=37327 RepID=UPI00146160B3|nr:hypothetical protein [Nocardia brevicatena]
MTEWGPGDARVGGVAVFDCPVPRPRRGRFATPAVDLVVWTPHGCTVVAIRGFGSVQHGPLDIRSTARWLVGDRPADLAVSKSAPNPLLQAHKQAAELRNCFRQHGLADKIEILIVLVPKTGSRITWNGTSPEPGSDIVLVRIGQSAALTEHFRRPRPGPVRWRIEDVTRAFEALDLDEHLPAPEELAVEGFTTSMPVWDLVPNIDKDPSVRTGALEPVAVGAGTVGADAGGYGETSVAVPVPPPSSDAPRVDAEIRRAEVEPSVSGHETENGVDAARADTDSGAGEVTGAAAGQAGFPAEPGSTGRGPLGSVSGASGPGAVAVDVDTDPISEGPFEVVAGTDAEPGTTRPGPGFGRAFAAQNPGQAHPAGSRLGRPVSAPDPQDADLTPQPVEPALGRRGGAVESVSAVASALVAGAGEWFETVRSTVGGVGRRSDHSRLPEAGDPTGRAEPPVSGDDPDAVVRVSRYVQPATAAPESEPKEEPRPETASSAEPVPDKAVSSVAEDHEAVTAAAEDTVVETGADAADSRHSAVDAAVAQKTAGSPAAAATGLFAGAGPGLGGPRTTRPVRTGLVHRHPTDTETEPYPAPYREGPLDRAAGWPVIGVALRRPVALLTAGVLVVVALVASAFAASGIARFDIEEYERMCAEPRGFTAAAAYASTGPSPVYLVGDLRVAGIAGSPVWRPEDSSSVQLVACLSSLRTGTLVRTCQYEPTGGSPIGRTLNLFRGVHRVTVYEARTGRLLAGVEVDGERFSADPVSTETDICRAAEGAPDDGLPGRRYGRPSQRQVRDVLDPLVRPDRAP